LYQKYLPPANPARLKLAFDHPKFLYELKHDGFRSLACIEARGCALISRRGHVYRGFEPLRSALAKLARPMVLGGEIVVLDGEGRSLFYDLLYHRGKPTFYAIDCLSLDGRDLRGEPLSRRKQLLKAAVKGVADVVFAPALHRAWSGSVLRDLRT
jgi:bifunctional non-homologous end joining protein LigD